MKAFTSTMHENSNQEFNYESLEFLGDTVLKTLATIQIFNDNPQFEEGDMHIGRARIVKNNNLKRVAVKNHLFRYIFTTNFSPWTPSGFTSKKSASQQERNRIKQMG